MAGRRAFPMFWMMMTLSGTLLGLRFTSMPVRQQEQVLLQIREAFEAFKQDPVNYTQNFFRISKYASNVGLVLIARSYKVLANVIRKREGTAGPTVAAGKKK